MLKNSDSEISILVIEDDDFCLDSLTDCFKRLLQDYADIETARSYDEAIEKTAEKYYHLITLDLEINGPAGNKFLGNDLLEIIREKDSPNFDSGLIIVTGYGTKKNLKKAIGSRYRVDEVILKEKSDWTDELIEASKIAIFDSLVRRLNKKKKIILNLSMNPLGSITEIELKGIKTGKRISLSSPINFSLPNFLRAADDIQNEILSKPAGAWRHKAKETGTVIYEKLILNSQLNGLLAAGRQESKRTNNQFYLQFTSPANYLNLPVELMFEKDFQVFDYVFVRRLAEAESDPTPFSEFVRETYQAEQSLKVLVVGANLNNPKYNCEKEARLIGELIEKNLNILGVKNSVKVLASAKEATYENLVRKLQNGCHILHFAGHSNHLASLPEESRINLYDRSIKAIDLKALLRNKQIQFVFLNSCLGARVGDTTGKGGYWGFMDALGAAGIPAVLGYRWLVDEQSAFILAYYFYENLFRTFCPAESLFRARNQASVETGRDYEVWASPVLLMQNL